MLFEIAREAFNVIEEYITDLALQMGIKISKVSVVDGKTVGCSDAYLLRLYSKGKIVNALLYEAEINDINDKVQNDRLEIRIRSALSRLSLMLEP
jgi:hypothetical protein